MKLLQETAIVVLILGGAFSCGEATPKTPLNDVISEITGGMPAPVLRADWDDGSGGEPEKVVIFHGKNLYYLAQSASEGWQVLAKEFVHEQNCPDPFFVEIAGSGHGCLLLGFNPSVGAPCTAYHLKDDGMEIGSFPETDPAALAALTAKLKKEMWAKIPAFTDAEVSSAAARVVELFTSGPTGD